MTRTAALGVGVLLAAAISSPAATIVGELWQNQISRVGNAALNNVPPGAPDAWFNPAAIDYDSRTGTGGYTLSVFLHNPTFYNTSAGFNPNASVDNTFFLFKGQTYLHAGDNAFLVPHDDGLQLNIDGIGLVVDKPGPTPPVTTPFTVHAPADGLYNFELSYGEGFGAPAVLSFKVNGAPVGNVPDGGSTLMLLTSGLGMLGFMVRRMRV